MKLLVLAVLAVLFFTFSACQHSNGYNGGADVVFVSIYWEPASEYIHFVARAGDSCCGQGSFTGLEVELGDAPALNDFTWVEVTGVLEEFFDEHAGDYFLRLNDVFMVEREVPENEPRWEF